MLQVEGESPDAGVTFRYPKAFSTLQVGPSLSAPLIRDLFPDDWIKAPADHLNEVKAWPSRWDSRFRRVISRPTRVFVLGIRRFRHTQQRIGTRECSRLVNRGAASVIVRTVANCFKFFDEGRLDWDTWMMAEGRVDLHCLACGYEFFKVLEDGFHCAPSERSGTKTAGASRKR